MIPDRKAARVRCTRIIEVWGPQEGCREFMSAPEAELRCTAPATHLIKYVDPYDREPVRERECAQHARQTARDLTPWGARVYRFRPDPVRPQ